MRRHFRLIVAIAAVTAVGLDPAVASATSSFAVPNHSALATRFNAEALAALARQFPHEPALDTERQAARQGRLTAAVARVSATIRHFEWFEVGFTFTVSGLVAALVLMFHDRAATEAFLEKIARAAIHHSHPILLVAASVLAIRGVYEWANRKAFPRYSVPLETVLRRNAAARQILTANDATFLYLLVPGMFIVMVGVILPLWSFSAWIVVAVTVVMLGIQYPFRSLFKELVNHLPSTTNRAVRFRLAFNGFRRPTPMLEFWKREPRVLRWIGFLSPLPIVIEPTAGWLKLFRTLWAWKDKHMAKWDKLWIDFQAAA